MDSVASFWLVGVMVMLAVQVLGLMVMLAVQVLGLAVFCVL